MTDFSDPRFHPTIRPRRLRTTPQVRKLVAETRLDPAEMVLPIFLVEGAKAPKEISSLPGVFQHSPNSYQEAVCAAYEAGVGAIMPFGVPLHKDAEGSGAIDPEGVLAQAVRLSKEACPEMVVIADLCLDEFTDHGHCGLLDADGNVDNDETLKQYARMGLALAEAGSDFLGASGMMDGQIGALRAALDQDGYRRTGLLAYAAKYASAFFGPFREAVQSSLQGDRKAYQQDPANSREALREISLDVAEGADIVMVKPALAYLDIVSEARKLVDVPVSAYVVSGEYAMIETAAAAGAFDRKRVILEALTSVKRAGAGIIANYWATEVAGWLREA